MAESNERKIHDVVIVGAGPAALTAAIYTTREDIETLLFERGVVGGLAAVTDLIDNYPGFPKGVQGLDWPRICGNRPNGSARLLNWAKLQKLAMKVSIKSSRQPVATCSRSQC